MSNRIPYNHILLHKARELRKNSTLGEVVLWVHLKKKQLKGIDFHRQKPILNYIVDFYAPRIKLAIEIDGYSHNEKSHYDKKRQKEIEKLGITVLRFKEMQVRKALEIVLQVIEKEVINRTYALSSVISTGAKRNGEISDRDFSTTLEMTA